MPAFICTACGTQYAPSDGEPTHCAICADERQFVPPGGQSWVTPEILARSHRNAWQGYEPGLLGVGTVPHFAIGQRALLLRLPGGNVLWECLSLIDAATVALIEGLGGLQGIAISHPHYYAAMADWSRAFGGVSIHLHAADRAWIKRADPAVSLWEGDTEAIADGVTLIRTGGHFEGGTVLHWAGGAGGRGALLSGDILQVVPDRKHVGFMRGYPTLIPLGVQAVRRMAERLAPYAYERVYGAFWDAEIPEHGKQAVAESVSRHIAWLEKPPLS